MALTTAVAASLAACDDDSPIVSEPSPVETATPTTEPTKGPDGERWRAKYDDKQLEAYEAALSRWEDFADRLEPIWEDGTVTPRARAIFDTYFTESASEVMLARQRELEANNIKTYGSAEVLWSRASDVAEDGGWVEIRQCVDLSNYRPERDGEPLERNKWADIPSVRVVSMTKPANGGPWLIQRYGDPGNEKKRCTA